MTADTFGVAGSDVDVNGRSIRVMASKAALPPKAPPQPIKPRPMQGETRGGGNGETK